MDKISNIRKQIAVKQAMIGEKYSLRVPQLARILSRGRMALVTAYRDNLSINENKQRNTELVQMLDKLNAKYKLTKGIWTKVEKSYLVQNIDFDDAYNIGKKFDQDAVVYAFKSGNIYLVDIREGTVELMVIKDLGIFKKDDMHTKLRDIGLELELTGKKWKINEIKKIEK